LRRLPRLVEQRRDTKRQLGGELGRHFFGYFLSGEQRK
jgi:hypothetical protein